MEEKSGEEGSREDGKAPSTTGAVTFELSTPLPRIHLYPRHYPLFRRSGLHHSPHGDLLGRQRWTSFPSPRHEASGGPRRNRRIRCPLHHPQGLVDRGRENRPHGLRSSPAMRPLRTEGRAVRDLCPPIYHPILVRQAIDHAPLGWPAHMVHHCHPRFVLDHSTLHYQEPQHW